MQYKQLINYQFFSSNKFEILYLYKTALNRNTSLLDL